MSEQEFYRKTQQYRTQLEVILQANVLGIKNGSATLHFNDECDIMKIERNDTLYKREKADVPKDRY